MNYPYLLFDADDTLFDFPKASALAFDTLCQKQHLPNTQASRQLYHEINQDLWSAFDRREISKEELVILRFHRFLSALEVSRDPVQCNRDYLDALGSGVYPLPHAEEVCRELVRRGHQLYIITNAVASVQRTRLKGSPFADLITAAFISEEAGAAKPDPAYYQYVFSKIPQLTTRNCLAIGDSLSSDVLGANRAGLPCCWFNPGREAAPKSLRIDYEIQDLRELLQIV